MFLLSARMLSIRWTIIGALRVIAVSGQTGRMVNTHPAVSHETTRIGAYDLETCTDSKPESHNCTRKRPAMPNQHLLLGVSNRGCCAYHHLGSRAVFERPLSIVGLDLLIENIQIPEELACHINPERGQLGI